MQSRFVRPDPKPRPSARLFYRSDLLALDMNDWIAIADVSECPSGMSIERLAGGRMVAIANVEGTFHAIDGLCPHQGGPLGTGPLCGTVLTCPWHGWQFDVTTGRHRLSATVRQHVYEVRVEHGRVLLRLADNPSPRVESQA